MRKYLTFGDVAEVLGCRAWHVDRAYKRGLLPEVDGLVANVRFYLPGQLPAVKDALVKAGYIRTEPVVAAGV